MEDTPANYNIPNQRFDAEYDDQDYDAIPEEEHDANRDGPSGANTGAKRRQRQADANGEGDELQAIRRKKKKKKRKVKKQTLEFLEPTDREISMANAYGGVAKG